jgi:hypothetical protein
MKTSPDAEWGLSCGGVPQAANLILAHQRHRAAALIPQVAQRLQAIGRPQAAAEVLEAIDDLKGGCCMVISVRPPRAYCTCYCPVHCPVHK